MRSLIIHSLCVVRGRLKAVAIFAREKQPSDTVLYDPCMRIITNLSIRQYSLLFPHKLPFYYIKQKGKKQPYQVKFPTIFAL